MSKRILSLLSLAARREHAGGRLRYRSTRTDCRSGGHDGPVATTAVEPTAETPATGWSDCPSEDHLCPARSVRLGLVLVHRRERHQAGRDRHERRRHDPWPRQVRPGKDGAVDRAGRGGQARRPRSDGDRCRPVPRADPEGARRRHPGRRLQRRQGPGRGQHPLPDLPGPGRVPGWLPGRAAAGGRRRHEGRVHQPAGRPHRPGHALQGLCRRPGREEHPGRGAGHQRRPGCVADDHLRLLHRQPRHRHLPDAGPQRRQPVLRLLQGGGPVAGQGQARHVRPGPRDQCRHQGRHDDVRHRPAAVPAGLWRGHDADHGRALWHPAGLPGDEHRPRLCHQGQRGL